MENKYRRTNTTVSLINYHFVFCPRYRRKIFLNSDIENRFKELVKSICNNLEIEILAIENFLINHNREIERLQGLNNLSSIGV